jgi:RNase H-like domain found in reverse transcriptase/Reverse transcriptase (RNA-dependent DNA polymerase)
MSTTLVDNLGLKREVLPQAINLQMAVQGSRSKINANATVDFEYATIRCKKTFDIINIASYDMILDTPFLWQHRILCGINSTRVAIGSSEPLPIQGNEVHTVMGAMAQSAEENIEEVRELLRREAQVLCEDASTSVLPPFRAINHHIPIIDEAKVYKYRPSKCPQALEPIWREKSGEYLGTGRWRIAAGSNLIPLLLIQKPRKTPDEPVRLRACFDKREQNANTRKLASPLPDQTEVLERVASRRFRSVIDGRDAYEQIRVAQEDVPKTLFNTPDGLMESLVLQQGDCNGPATYQTLMNFLFAGYIGVWMDVYLDDIMVYSDTISDHIKHLRTVFKILKREKLFLNSKKMQFLSPELEILGHRITDAGIIMDPHKVDAIAKWPTPTNKDLLASFIGAVGYLAGGTRGIRIPMAILNKITGSTKTWRWGPTEQRAFDQTKALVEAYRKETRKPLPYEPDAPRIWLITDASMTGAAGHVCQGNNWKTAKPVAFWSGKFSSAEQAYPTHEQELLAIFESLKRFRHHLLGIKFTIVTDHERLEKFMTQKDLSRRQTRWLETLCDFDFDIMYSPGKDITFADALSRIYSNDAKGTVRAESEYVSKGSEDDDENAPFQLFNIEPSIWPSRPIVVGNELFAEAETMMARENRVNLDGNKENFSGPMKGREEANGDDLPNTEVTPKRGRGRPRKSVPENTIKPVGNLPVENASVAPSPSNATEWPSSAIPAKSAKRSLSESDEGESEMEEREENIPKYVSKKQEYLRMLERKRREAEAASEPSESDDGESEIEEIPNNTPKYTSKKMEYLRMIERRNAAAASQKDDGQPEHRVDAKTTRQNAIEIVNQLSESESFKKNAQKELVDADADLQAQRIPHPSEEQGSMERSMDIKLTDIIKEVEFPHDLRGKYAKGNFFSLVLQNSSHYANFEVAGNKEEELIYLKDTDRRVLCIPDVMIGSRKAREIVQ